MMISMLIHNRIIPVILLIVIRCVLISLETSVSKCMSLTKHFPPRTLYHILHNCIRGDDCNSTLDIGCSECQKLVARRAVGEKLLQTSSAHDYVREFRETCISERRHKSRKGV